MTDVSWAKPKGAQKRKRSERVKFIAAGLIILVAVLILLISGTLQGARYFITVDELLSDAAYQGRTVRIAGAVDGESIDYDSERAIIRFEIVNIPNEYEDLATALREALLDKNARRLKIVVEDAAIPDLLQHEAQAILTGALGRDGVFAATELLLKCPSRFEESTAPEGLSRIPEHQ
ncbi:MAG: cytochrome c maturation protein CcmE [Chloroflexota bacterium]|nr:cytochrome c maturation protein CcmE [Chloroflexota bacterium]MDE2947274.1 cytochrome c maturation protein CcmE [Chloroflexota bacterium]